MDNYDIAKKVIINNFIEIENESLQDYTDLYNFDELKDYYISFGGSIEEVDYISLFEGVVEDLFILIIEGSEHMTLIEYLQEFDLDLNKIKYFYLSSNRRKSCKYDLRYIVNLIRSNLSEQDKESLLFTTECIIHNASTKDLDLIGRFC